MLGRQLINAQPSQSLWTKVEKYLLKTDSTLTYFKFISIVTKGVIRKMIEFQATTTPGVYSPAFDDKDFETGELNDLAVTNKGDFEKVLRAVVRCVYLRIIFLYGPER
jgi:hypothetical protein